MCLFVCAGQVLEIKMGVDLRGIDVRMAQKFLDTAQIPTGFKQMRGKGVPQHVGIQMLWQPRGARHCAKAQLYRALAQTCAIAADKNSLLVGCSQARALAQPAAQCPDSHRAYWNHALLSSLSENPDCGVFEVELR